MTSAAALESVLSGILLECHPTSRGTLIMAHSRRSCRCEPENQVLPLLCLCASTSAREYFLSLLSFPLVLFNVSDLLVHDQ